MCDIYWCRCQQLTALSISTALVTKLSHRAAAAPGPEIRRECPMTKLTALPLLATNPGNATGCDNPESEIWHAISHTHPVNHTHYAVYRLTLPHTFLSPYLYPLAFLVSSVTQNVVYKFSWNQQQKPVPWYKKGWLECGVIWVCCGIIKHHIHVVDLTFRQIIHTPVLRHHLWGYNKWLNDNTPFNIVFPHSGVTRVGDTRGGNWGCRPSIFSWKTWQPFFSLVITTISAGVTRFFLSWKTPDLFFAFLRVSPPGGCHPDGPPPSLPPSDAIVTTVESKHVLRYITYSSTTVSCCRTHKRRHWETCTVTAEYLLVFLIRTDV